MNGDKVIDQGALAPSDRPDLTTRSSQLARRGLELIDAQQARVVRFPLDRSVGTLQVRDPGSNRPPWCPYPWLCEARGTVVVPTAKELKLWVGPGGVPDLSWLAALGSNDLQLLHVRYEGLTDADLGYLRGLTGLKFLELSSSRYVTAAGLLVHLAPLKGLGILQLGHPIEITGGTRRALERLLPNCDIMDGWR